MEKILGLLAQFTPTNKGKGYKMPLPEERLARLEAKQEVLLQAIKDHMEKEERDREILMGELNELKRQAAKQKGFIGGVIFVVSAIWAVVLAIFKFKIGTS